MVATHPATEVAICNLALDRVGEKGVSSIDSPTTDTERIMARWYDHIRRVCLRECVWNWAQGYTVLARAGDGTVGEHADSYNLPSDFIRLNSVGRYIDDPIVDYDINGDAIEASEGDELPIRYNKDITDVTLFDPLFVDFFVQKLAEAVAYKFTKKRSVAEMMAQSVAMATPKAFSVDGQERKPRRIEQSKMLTARRAASGGALGRDNRYYEYSD
jgi:hypothetical protein